MSSKEDFIQLVETQILRTGIEALMRSLKKTDFYTAPASTKYHGSYNGGLVDHSVNVYTALCDFAGEEYDLETITTVSLFHDLCKANYYKTDTRNTKDANGKWIQVPYYTVDDQLPLGHGEKSILLLSEYINLTREEMLAIRWHMGGFEAKENYSYVSKAYEQCPLALYLHLADMKATYKLDKRTT